jgi:hypothetical protein
MKLVMTMMVRDEADIIGAVLDYHLAQGVDTIIVTDNSSIDGTTEILEQYASDGRIDLRHDPVQRKQQSPVVTQMARDAYTIHGADWVLNADADEFWSCTGSDITLAEAFAQIPKSIASFSVPVTDMTGPPASDGTGLQRLVYQDHRTLESLHKVGLLAHSTHDAAHIGADDVNVVQGNHYVSIGSQGAPEPEFEIGVRHYPWRSWTQFSNKVRNAGTAYESQTILTPSPNHHGMRDYRRLNEGTLRGSYVLRHPSSEEIEAGLLSGEFVLDEQIARAASSPTPDVPLDAEIEHVERILGGVVEAREALRIECELREAAAAERINVVEAEKAELRALLLTRDATINSQAQRIHALEVFATQLRNRRVVRAADAVARRLHGR